MHRARVLVGYDSAGRDFYRNGLRKTSQYSRNMRGNKWQGVMVPVLACQSRPSQYKVMIAELYSSEKWTRKRESGIVESNLQAMIYSKKRSLV